jgi:hypothetical protein
VSTANLLEDALGSFGIDVNADELSKIALLAIAERREYDLLLWWTDGRPHHAYGVTAGSPSALAGGVNESASDRSPEGMPLRPSIPGLSGSDEASRTVDLVEQWRRIRRPSPTEETKAAVALLARWWNHDLPQIDLATHVTGVWGNTRDFEWPKTGDRAVRTSGPANRPEYHLLKEGLIRPAAGGG